MSFQGTINKGIGTIGTLAGIKKVVEGQQKSNELNEDSNAIAKANLQAKALEAEQEEMNAKDALLQNDSDIYDREVSEKGYANAITDPDKALDSRYNEAKEK